MKTIYEWIEICKKAQPKIGQQWEDNVIAQRLVASNMKYSSMADAVFEEPDCGNFLWAESPQGQAYWGDIREDMRKNPDKYIIKRKLFNKV
jgi:hypothetical protein